MGENLKSIAAISQRREKNLESPNASKIDMFAISSSFRHYRAVNKYVIACVRNWMGT
jgi:hypothetical protein